MKQIYHEVAGKSGHHKANSPTVRVRVYVPSREDDYDLPAIIMLEHGKANTYGELEFNWETQYQLEGKRNHDQPLLIRRAINLFDQLKDKVWSEGE